MAPRHDDAGVEVLRPDHTGAGAVGSTNVYFHLLFTNLAMSNFSEWLLSLLLWKVTWKWGRKTKKT